MRLKAVFKRFGGIYWDRWYLSLASIKTPLKRIVGGLCLIACQAVSSTLHGLPKLVNVVFHDADNGVSGSA